MSGTVQHNRETRTTTLVWGPFAKPLSQSGVRLLARLKARTIGLGYAVMKTETDESITLTAVLSAPRTQPFTRVRELVPGAVVTAHVGEATAEEDAC